MFTAYQILVVTVLLGQAPSSTDEVKTPEEASVETKVKVTRVEKTTVLEPAETAPTVESAETTPAVESAETAPAGAPVETTAEIKVQKTVTRSVQQPVAKPVEGSSPMKVKRVVLEKNLGYYELESDAALNSATKGTMGLTGAAGDIEDIRKVLRTFHLSPGHKLSATLGKFDTTHKFWPVEIHASGDVPKAAVRYQRESATPLWQSRYELAEPAAEPTTWELTETALFTNATRNAWDAAELQLTDGTETVTIAGVTVVANSAGTAQLHGPGALDVTVNRSDDVWYARLEAGAAAHRALLLTNEGEEKIRLRAGEIEVVEGESRQHVTVDTLAAQLLEKDGKPAVVFTTRIDAALGSVEIGAPTDRPYRVKEIRSGSLIPLVAKAQEIEVTNASRAKITLNLVVDNSILVGGIEVKPGETVETAYFPPGSDPSDGTKIDLGNVTESEFEILDALAKLESGAKRDFLVSAVARWDAILDLEKKKAALTDRVTHLETIRSRYLRDAGSTRDQLFDIAMRLSNARGLLRTNENTIRDEQHELHTLIADHDAEAILLLPPPIDYDAGT